MPTGSKGIRIYEYLPLPPHKLHAQTAVSDDEWCIIGLPNLDHLSLFVNYELAFLPLARGLGNPLWEQSDGQLGSFSSQPIPEIGETAAYTVYSHT
jgi:hypothetical protein